MKKRIKSPIQEKEIANL